jgi:hypothetical protein
MFISRIHGKYFHRLAEVDHSFVFWKYPVQLSAEKLAVLTGVLTFLAVTAKQYWDVLQENTPSSYHILNPSL